MTIFRPNGFIQRKYTAVAPSPSTYNETTRTVDAVLSTGSPVKRFYGTEVLRIDPESVIVNRLSGSGIPLLDSHSQASAIAALGKVSRIWFAGASTPALMGTLAFNATVEGRKAEGMVARGEIAGISLGYAVNEWEISDQEGNIVDSASVNWDDVDLAYTATKWELLECSLVSIAADAGASIRGLGLGAADTRAVDDVRQRAFSRQRMHERMRALH